MLFQLDNEPPPELPSKQNAFSTQIAVIKVSHSKQNYSQQK